MFVQLMAKSFPPAAGLVLLLVLVPAAPALAQDEEQPGRIAELETKVALLESEVTLLESEVTLIRERLEALLGSEPRYTVQELPVGNSPIRGNPEAPITLVMFGDYQSDYTTRAQHVVKRLLKAYPEALRFVYKHYPLTQIHPHANEAALAAIAAERQDLFWEFHDKLFLNSRRLDPTLILVLAEEVGLDLTRLEQDRRSLSALARLAEDEKAAVAAGVSGLPTLFLNGRMLPTWRYDYLRSQIDRLLNR